MHPPTGGLLDRLFFGRKDYELLTIVGDVLDREDLLGFKHLLTPYLHPRGIKELAATQGLRIAYAAANLLGSLEIGKAHDRINALRALRDEVMNASVTYLRRNTARVLMQIMKELVRTKNDPRRQLELAHDFHLAATGKARVIARLLDRYRLLLMPEDWVQLAFDNHVHDANTKGRKSATHLIMDAWIKGIRHLTVIYYNFVLPNAAEELLQAAQIMGITVRIGIEFSTRFGKKPVKIIWVPRGFTAPPDFLTFLREPAVAAFMDRGRSLAKLQEEQLLHVLDEFNANVLPDFNSYFGLDCPPAAPDGFRAAVGSGQASLLHLGKYLHAHLLPHLTKRFEEVQNQYFAASSQEEKARIEGLAEEMNTLDAEAIVDDYLDALVSPDAPAIGSPGGVSPLYCPIQSPAGLIDEVSVLRVGSRFILNLQGMDCEEVLGVLELCSGRITHLEVVNLKNSALGNAADSACIATMQQMINAKSVLPLKRWVMARMAQLEDDHSPEAAERLERLSRLLEAVPGLHSHYRDRPLRTSIGSDSTGQSCRSRGMGLVARETLPPKAVRNGWASRQDPHEAMVVGMRVEPRVVYEPRESAHAMLDALYQGARRYPWLRFIGYRPRREFRCRDFFPARGGESNILVMGGMRKGCGNDFTLRADPETDKPALPSLSYLNNNVKNVLKVLGGFLPAFLTFFLTREWWVLAYLGGVIWLSITGVRNIIQSVLGGGGFSRTPLLKWNDYVSWSRFSDSLLYTGLSVPLLDYLVKTVALDRGLGVNVTTNPTALYTVMALVNGLYICTHNLLRGLPRKAAFWNLLRSALSIPLAMAVSAGLGLVIAPHDPALAGAILQQWAAVISKLSSDGVAAVIEGLADRDANLHLRLRDFQEKIAQMLSVQEKLEVLFPKSDVLGMLADPEKFVNTLVQKRADLANAVIVNSLDSLYFWMYQPRGRSALGRIMRDMDPQTRQIFLLSQYVLLCKREISQLFLDGLLGKNFSKGLAFYLDYADTYLDALQGLASRVQPSADVKPATAGRSPDEASRSRP